MTERLKRICVTCKNSWLKIDPSLSHVPGNAKQLESIETLHRRRTRFDPFVARFLYADVIQPVDIKRLDTCASSTG